MKKIDLGQFLSILANFGVIIGILLLVFELNQARQFARVEFVQSNLSTFQEIERQMMNPAVAEVWAKAAVDPSSMTFGDIRVMDAYLANHLNFWRQNWTLEQEKFVDSGTTILMLETNVPFYFGNTFALGWWEDVKSSHADPEDQAFDELVDNVLTHADFSANRKFLENMQRLLME
jgi:hypothetical protein